MRKIICRFSNEKDLTEFCSINQIELTNLTKSYNLLTKEIKYRKPKKEIVDRPVYLENMKYWKGMPYFHSYKEDIYAEIEFFVDDLDSKCLSEFFIQPISDKTKSVWYPKLLIGSHSHYRVIGGGYVPNVPIYVVSKGRWLECTTSMHLSLMEVPHFVVVEPQEFENYKKHVENDYAVVIKLDMNYKDNYDAFDDLGSSKSKGPGGARNFAWEHSISLGAKWHWVMDDNTLTGFYYFFNNKRIRVRSGAFFNALEDFVERFENIAIAGLNYRMFCSEMAQYPPFTTNTRIYSYLLIRNDIPYRWRGRYNEDTDLSLRVLKDGWCTVQFNAFLASKVETQSKKGGNTAEFYSKEGTLSKSQMLQEMHPDVTKVVWKFSRWHHEVDYSGFNQPLIYKPEYQYLANTDQPVNMYGMRVIETVNEDSFNTSKTYTEQKYSNAEDITFTDISKPRR